MLDLQSHNLDLTVSCSVRTSVRSTVWPVELVLKILLGIPSVSNSLLTFCRFKGQISKFAFKYIFIVFSMLTVKQNGHVVYQ